MEVITLVFLGAAVYVWGLAICIPPLISRTKRRRMVDEYARRYARWQKFTRQPPLSDDTVTLIVWVSCVGGVILILLPVSIIVGVLLVKLVSD